MSTRLPHLEIARGEHGLETAWGTKPFHARLVKNGNVIWYTPNYAHKNGVRRAIEIACGGAKVGWPAGRIWHPGWDNGVGWWIEVRDLT